MEKLNYEEIFCLQKYGMETLDIMNTDLERFDNICDENPEFDDWLEKAEKLFDRQQSLGIKTLTCQDECFPSALKHIGNDCPPMIHCLGNVELLKKEDAVAVIGARSCDRQGYGKAYDLAVRYAGEGSVIVSGLAIGCDTAAHRGALAVYGATIAIVATGLDHIYPRESEGLQAEILRKGGLILSEQIVGTKANPTRLIARNRLQAALSGSVILAQCPAKSGSLHTMRFARKYHKQSFAAAFPRWYTENLGNKELLEADLARPI